MRETILQLPVCFPAKESPSEKGAALKGKNLLPLGANSFLLEHLFFSEGDKTKKRLPSLKCTHSP